MTGTPFPIKCLGVFEHGKIKEQSIEKRRRRRRRRKWGGTNHSAQRFRRFVGAEG